MKPIRSNNHNETDQTIFDPDLLESNPKKAQTILEKLPKKEQVRYLSQLNGKQKLHFLYLSSKSEELVQSLSPEEAYFIVKENGESDSTPVLSAISSEQLQYFFDLEWWKKDRFLPRRAVDWLLIMHQCNPKKLLDWFLQEELDQVVTLLKNLTLIYKNDEMTNSYSGVAGFKHYSPDGVYDFFFLDPKAIEPLKSILKLMRDQYPNFFFNIIEASIWYQKEPTEEMAYRWRTTRTSLRGIPELEEALEIYSRLDPKAIRELPPSEENFFENHPNNPPTYIIANANPDSFFVQCWALLKEDRKKLIHWELVYLANKLMVADNLDPGKLEDHKKAITKSLSFVNLGLEISAQKDIKKGAHILKQTWMQPIFQVGYGYLINLKNDALEILKDEGILLDRIISDQDKNILSALTVFSIPMTTTNKKNENLLKNFDSLNEIQKALQFLKKLKFFKRFTKQSLELSESIFELIFYAKEIENRIENIPLKSLLATALARFTLFQKISCEPLAPIAAESFLKLVFIPKVPPGEIFQVCDDEVIGSFYSKILETPIAWTADDREFLSDILAQTVQELENQFGMINLRKPINWKYIDILIVQLNQKSKFIN